MASVPFSGGLAAVALVFIVAVELLVVSAVDDSLHQSQGSVFLAIGSDVDRFLFVLRRSLRQPLLGPAQ
jgi:hypothetical protein